MSKLAEYRQLERHLAQQIAALEAMKGDKGLEEEIKFETELRSLLVEYKKSLRDVVALLDPMSLSKSPRISVEPRKSTRKPRSLKTYKNPHNGETIQTKGGNHSVLKSWKAQYGSDTVESWLS